VTPRGEIWIGPIELIDGRWRDPVPPRCLAASLPAAETVQKSNTISLELRDLDVRLRPTGLRSQTSRRRLADKSLRFGDLYDGLTPSPLLREQIADVIGERRQSIAGSYVPIFYRGIVVDDRAHLYGRARFHGGDAVFIRTSEEPVPVDDDDELLRLALEAHAKDPTFINNHQCYYRKCLAGHEAEYKLTLSSDADIWALTASFHDLVKRGKLPGFVLEYRDGLQVWDYVNHLFEVLSPEPERGYVSFIPTTDGLFTCKRKWFVRDALIRREELRPGISIEGSLEEHLRQHLDAETRRLPSFRRVRYDVNFESVETGHVYGVFFDHCSLLESPQMALTQCEVEYLRSRTLVRPDESAVLPELAAVTDWIRAFLTARRQPFQESFYSKLSFLRDVVDGAVPPAPRVAGRT
jgi:hypothetical protein